MEAVGLTDLSGEAKVYCCFTNRYKLVKSPTLKKFHSFGMAQDDTYVYIIGGEDAVSVYSFKIATGECMKKSRLNVPRVYPAAVIHQGELYAIGGAEIQPKINARTLTSVEVISSDAISFAEPINISRKLAAAVSVEPYIYLAGGISDSFTLQSVERFGKSNGWVVLQMQLDVPRFWCGIAGLDTQKLLLFGGRRAGGERISTGVVVDFEKNELQILPFKVLGDYRSKSVVLKDISAYTVLAWKIDDSFKKPTTLTIPISTWSRRVRLLKLRAILASI